MRKICFVFSFVFVIAHSVFAGPLIDCFRNEFISALKKAEDTYKLIDADQIERLEAALDLYEAGWCDLDMMKMHIVEVRTLLGAETPRRYKHRRFVPEGEGPQHKKGRRKTVKVQSKEESCFKIRISYKKYRKLRRHQEAETANALRAARVALRNLEEQLSCFQF